MSQCRATIIHGVINYNMLTDLFLFLPSSLVAIFASWVSVEPETLAGAHEAAQWIGGLLARFDFIVDIHAMGLLVGYMFYVYGAFIIFYGAILVSRLFASFKIL